MPIMKIFKLHEHPCHRNIEPYIDFKVSVKNYTDRQTAMFIEVAPQRKYYEQAHCKS